ncbi:uncharacterized protein MONOS_3339 [Monocercomonoides exilis]|uniref:uncharacterized protein n=1 Tax=Monocercomonoides exilis TaxID=2049356 RepID=UPI003559F45E|nr:hypothetical protein MONOS_3339 [Monocercomonoides exilis]|eukprot:MONOS_3339.1-p1 / transcript=MONOS_3339.1 / gene=MONOS_3339 / organism=Monocercomonoides_exilis_PA203 / gene_product=unspecified product / transcript_product=unspecified product / location=Mono_scaffold00077:139835-140671(+) / protein_length=249 / sequence_SO=supercontig / SO=protein_coding / is_pseudo=false
MAWKAWTVGQLRHEQATDETDIRLSGIDEEDEERYSQLGTREMQVSEEGVQTVDEACKEKRGSPDQELCIVWRSYQRNTVRHERHFASNEQTIPGPQQSCDEGTMECDDESQPLYHQTNIWMEEKTNQEGTKAMDIIRSPPGGLFQPILQLQGDVGCLNVPQALPPTYPWAPHTHNLAKIRQHDSGLRHHSLGRGNESPFSTKENTTNDMRTEHSDGSGSPPGSKERDRGLLIKTPACRRLRDHMQSA